MQISVKFLFAILAATAAVMATQAPASVLQPVPAPQNVPLPGTHDDPSPHPGRGFPGGARGMLGTVTEITGDHYTIKTDQGETYTVHYSVNTRIVKQGAGRRGPGGGGRRADTAREPNSSEEDRPNPEPLKPTDIKVGDVITAGGEVDAAAKSIGAIFILQLDPERAKQAREMQANYGKTWLAGRITAIDGTRITIEGAIDHSVHAIEVDENTSFRKRRDSITLADIQPGDQLRAEGALKGNVFLATTVNAMTRPNPDQLGRETPAQPH